MRLLAPAKINLYLEVLGKRADGYHEIETMMQTVSLCDEILLREREEGVVVRCSHPDVPEGEGNLAWRAASLLIEKFAPRRGVEIEINKRIPVGGGLGGGSSDAAAVIKGLNEMWRLGLETDEMLEIAQKIGSDVPFFLYGGTAVCRGRGEIVEPIGSDVEMWFVLIDTGIACSTGEVYDTLDKIELTTRGDGIKIMVQSCYAGQLADIGRGMFNRLEEAAFHLHSSLRRAKEVLKSLGFLGVVLCGSGGCFAGLARGREAAEELAREVVERHLGRVSVVSNRIEREEGIFWNGISRK